jgi:hypothetical protein
VPEHLTVLKALEQWKLDGGTSRWEEGHKSMPGRQAYTVEGMDCYHSDKTLTSPQEGCDLSIFLVWIRLMNLLMELAIHQLAGQED